MQIELSPAEAIAAALGISSYHARINKHYLQRGVPGFMHEATEDHIRTQESAHAAILKVLRAEGYIMRDDDLEPIDWDAIKAVKYKTD